MDEINWTSVLVAYAAPVFSFLGLIAQFILSNRSKTDKKQQTEELGDKIEENTRLARENKALIETNTKTIQELKDKLSANDVATVAVVRQNIRKLYYKLQPYQMISITDYRALNEMYNAYKGVTLPDGHHPNSWCDALYEEMSSWKRVEVYPATLAHLIKSVEEKENK